MCLSGLSAVKACLNLVNVIIILLGDFNLLNDFTSFSGGFPLYVIITLDNTKVVLPALKSCVSGFLQNNAVYKITCHR